MVNLGDLQPHWVSFQYKRLPIFCYWCGLLNHDEKDCTLWTGNDGTMNRDDQQYGPWLRTALTNIQQPQIVNNKTIPATTPTHGPSRSLRPKPSPPTAKATTPPTPTSLAQTTTPPPPTPSAKFAPPCQPTLETTINSPANSATVSQSMPTVTDILADTNLLNAHLTDIDNNLNFFPTISQPAASPKDILDLGTPPLNEIPDFPPPTDTRSFPSPQTNATCHTITSPNTSCTTRGTWKRLEHAKHVMDTSDITLPTIGPKRKVEALHGMHGTSLDKKQKLNDETTTNQLTVHTMGSAVPTKQDHRVQ